MNASFLEIVQTLFAASGGAMTLVSKINADRNLAAVNRSGFNGVRTIIARKNCRTENILLAVQVGLFLAGLWTLFTAPPPFEAYAIGDEARSPLARAIQMNITITRVAMVWASAWLMYLSYRNWIDLAPLRAQRRSDGATGASVVEKAQAAATTAQNVATEAQTVASDAQVVATEALDASKAEADKTS